MTKAYEIINIIAITQGLFLAAVLFLRKNTSQANKIISVLLMTMSINQSFNFFYFITPEITYYLTSINVSSYLLYGPLVYGYVLCSTENQKQIRPGYLLHFVPFVIVLAVLTFQTHFISETVLTETMATVQLYNRGSLFSFRNIMIFFLFVMMGYICASLLKIMDYRKRSRKFYSDEKKLIVRWLTLILTLGFTFAVILILLVIHQPEIKPGGSIVYAIILLLTSTFLLSTMGVTFFTIHFPELFNNFKIIKNAPRYEKQRLDEKTSDSYLDRILEYMHTEKPYLDDSLTLNDLSARVDIPVHHLSMILNKNLNQNFFMFVNTYRVSEVKAKLDDPVNSDKNILTIAFESGFNSKTTFNTIFKKVTGMTPTKYKKTARK